LRGWCDFRFIVDGTTDDDDDVDIRRFWTYVSIVELILLFTNGLEWIVIGDVAAEQQWHKLKIFIVVDCVGGINDDEEEEVFPLSNNEQCRHKYDVW